MAKSCYGQAELQNQEYQRRVQEAELEIKEFPKRLQVGRRVKRRTSSYLILYKSIIHVLRS